MTIVLVLLPLTLLLVGIAVWAFFWAVGDGQFDDMDSPAYRILLDDDDWSDTGKNERRADEHGNTRKSDPASDKHDHDDDRPPQAPQ